MAPLLALDTGSAIVSVAVGERDRFETLSAPQGRSSRELIAMIDELLTRAGMEPRDLSGIGAARGPGSFTGLRVGLATALGLHQALGVRAGGASTFEILAAYYFERVENGATEVAAVIDALRERWYTQPMRLDEHGRVGAAGPPEIRDRADLVHDRLPLVGHGISRFPAPAGSIEPSELAPTLLRLMADGALGWDGGALTEPLYLRSPATSSSSRPPGSPRPNRRRRRGQASAPIRDSRGTARGPGGAPPDSI